MPIHSQPSAPLARWVCLPLAVLLVGASCGPTAGTSRDMPPMPETEVLLQGAALGVGDVIEVRVYQEKGLTGLYRVEPSGNFTFPLVGEIKAEGLNPGELARNLTEKLKAGYLRDPQVSVFVKEFNSKKVFVLGEVARPGTFQYEDKMTVVQAVTLAGGLKALAAKNSLVLTRQVDGAEKKFLVPFEQIGLGQEQNIVMQPGDILFVPESWL